MMGQKDQRGLHNCLAWLLVRILGPWASDSEDWNPLPAVYKMTGNCYQPPGSLSNCSDNPAFSEVLESTVLLPPQCVAQVSSRNGRLLNNHPGFQHTNLLSILSNLPWELKDPGVHTKKGTCAVTWCASSHRWLPY